jgi:FkbM family methyltransferase
MERMSLNPLTENERRLHAGELTKAEYIERMYDTHRTLFAYSDFIRSRNVEKLVISAGEILLTTKNGITLVCNPEDLRTIGVEILNFGNFEAAESQLLLRYVEPDSVVVDIGANIGWYCILLGRAAAKGRILAFEPIPVVRQYLERNLELNAIRNVALYGHGLSDEEKELVFYFHPNLSGATSARNLMTHLDTVEVRANVRRMDDVLAAEPRIDLLKCDIEGAELFALRGGLETIGRTRPVLFVEMLRKWSAKFDYHPNDIIDLLAPLDYRCFAVNQDGALTRLERMDDSTTATNFIFLHAGRHAGWENR